MKKNTPQQTGRPILAPAVLSLYEERHDVEEIARLVDKRPLGELKLQVEDALTQIVTRAHAGDDDALMLYVYLARATVQSFDKLVRHELKRTRDFAERCPDFPVLFSLNPQDIKAAKERMRSLNVGAKAIRPTRSGQRIDRRNLWTRLANSTFDTCQENSRLVPQIEKYLAGVGAKPRQWKVKWWGTSVEGTQYALPDGQRIVVADWQKDGGKLANQANLAGQITGDSFKQWHDVVRMCVLEFWKHSPKGYNQALKDVGDPKDRDGNHKLRECDRRHLAMNRTLQAFKNQYFRG